MSHEELLNAVRKMHGGRRQYLRKTFRQPLANRPPRSDLRARTFQIMKPPLPSASPWATIKRH